MTKALERLDELDRSADQPDLVVWPEHLAAAGNPRNWSPRGAARDTGSRRQPTRMGATVVVVLVVAAGLFFPDVLSRLFPARAEQPIGTDVPPAGVDAAASRILPTVRAEADGGSFAFLQTQPDGDDPVTFDPCRPVRYVTRVGAAGPDATRLVDEAAAEISAATGLRLVNDGSTEEAPSEDREPYQPDRYGDKWAPVLIAWSDPEESPNLEGKVAGYGGGQPWADTHGRLTYVTGQVALDTPALREGFDSAENRAMVRAVIVHELAHVLGAAHVDDPEELMSAENTGQTALGPGDRQGLALLGQGSCAPGL